MDIETKAIMDLSFLIKLANIEYVLCIPQMSKMSLSLRSSPSSGRKRYAQIVKSVIKVVRESSPGNASAEECLTITWGQERLPGGGGYQSWVVSIKKQLARHRVPRRHFSQVCRTAYWTSCHFRSWIRVRKTQMEKMSRRYGQGWSERAPPAMLKNLEFAVKTMGNHPRDFRRDETWPDLCFGKKSCWPLYRDAKASNGELWVSWLGNSYKSMSAQL